MFKVTMRYDWHDGVVFKFDTLASATNFMRDAFANFVPSDEDQKLDFVISKFKEETEDAEAVCGTEEG